MSLKTLLFALGALALAACASPTEPRTADVEALRVGPGLPTWWASRIAFESYRDDFYGEIYVMDADGFGQVRLTNHRGYDRQPALSPDASKIAFTSRREWGKQIYVMNATDGSEIRRLENISKYGGESAWSPAWSPDGLKIAFTSTTDEANQSIYVMNAKDGSETVRLTFGDYVVRDDDPAWSPDGSQIAFTRRMENGFWSARIWVMNAKDGSGSFRLPTTSFAHKPAWSPNGLKIAFEGSDGIYVMNANGSGQARLPTTSVFDGEPAWSPDGSKIAFTSTRDGNAEIYVMNATDGSGPVRLTTNPAVDIAPSWARPPLLLQP